MDGDLLRKLLRELRPISPRMRRALEGKSRFLLEEGQWPLLLAPEEERDEWEEAEETMTPEEFRAWVNRKLKERLEGG